MHLSNYISIQVLLLKKTHNTHNEIICRGQSYIKRVFGVDAEKCKKKGK